MKLNFIATTKDGNLFLVESKMIAKEMTEEVANEINEYSKQVIKRIYNDLTNNGFLVIAEGFAIISSEDIKTIYVETSNAQPDVAVEDESNDE